MKKRLGEILKLSSESKALAKKQDKIRKVLKPKEESYRAACEKLFSRKFTESFGKHEVYKFIYVGHGSHYCHIESIDGVRRAAQGFWFKYKDIKNQNDYEHNIERVPAPVKTTELNKFIKSFGTETGLEVQFKRTKIKTAADIKSIQCADDLMVKYGIEVKAHGDIWHKGWDIPDKFYIAFDKSSGLFRLFYTSDGHGFGSVEETPQSSEGLSQFIKSVGVDDNNEEVISSYEKQIFENWKLTK